MQQTYHISLKELPSDERPREKLIKYGPQALKDSELLAIILTTGIRGKFSVLELSDFLFKLYGTKGLSKEKSVSELMNNTGLPKVKATQVIACMELGRRIFYEDKSRVPTIKTPEEVFKYLSDMQKLTKEQFRGLYLNTRNRLIHDEVISMGSLNLSVVHPREVFRPAVEYGAAAVILAHNHPSGDPEPSTEDIKITKQLVEAGKLMEIEVLDHLIIGEEKFISLKEKGIC
jgi:DNA repair protein RadC